MFQVFFVFFLKMIQNTLMLEGVHNWLQKNDQSSNPELGTMFATYRRTSQYPYSFKAVVLGFQGGLCGLSGGTTVQIWMSHLTVQSIVRHLSNGYFQLFQCQNLLCKSCGVPALKDLGTLLIQNIQPTVIFWVWNRRLWVNVEKSGTSLTGKAIRLRTETTNLLFYLLTFIFTFKINTF